LTKIRFKILSQKIKIKFKEWKIHDQNLLLFMLSAFISSFTLSFSSDQETRTNLGTSIPNQSERNQLAFASEILVVAYWIWPRTKQMSKNHTTLYDTNEVAKKLVDRCKITNISKAQPKSKFASAQVPHPQKVPGLTKIPVRKKTENSRQDTFAKFKLPVKIQVSAIF